MPRISVFALIAGTLMAVASAGHAQTMQTTAGKLTVEPMLTGLQGPWALAFLPDGGFLVTEKRGRLLLVKDGEARTVNGLPDIHVEGQGGLLDVMVPRDFAQTGEVFLTHAKADGRGAGTALTRAVLDVPSARLTDVDTIFEMLTNSRGGRHFGSRVVEGPQGHIFMTIGERGDRPAAQDLTNHNGTVIRLKRDGSIPADNPFANTPGAQPEIWSYGHRNPQGAAIDASGQLWINEHGARGGDEVNRIQKGANFGWPVIAYGRHYSGLKIGEGTTKLGMEQPAYYWDPSIAPSGMTFYSGSLGDWSGDAFVGSLKFDYIARLDDQTMAEVERLKSPETDRVRDVRTGPDGALWFISEGNGAVYRLSN